MFYDFRRGGLLLRGLWAWRSSPIRHAFTDRHGGVSKGVYSSLNVGLHVGDDLEQVRENRRRVCAVFGWGTDQLVAAQQVHGNGVAVVTSADKGRGASRTEDSVANVDALVTAAPDVALIAFFADCVPILLYDPVTPAVGVVHAGWKGTAMAAVCVAVKTMQQQFGTEPARLHAAIGPAIGPCCYTVGEDVAQQLLAAPKDGLAAVFGDVVARRDDKLYANLPRANELLLQKTGLLSRNIFTDRMCTRCHSERFFSYRASAGKTGRMAAVIGLGSVKDEKRFPRP